ncbi:lysophospholipid acyltransferase family protein [Pontibacter sp. G13]|uniref:lysophospholipid acyltransferase family protein n=1 Tax=Pontibacter sp. G13 TaxID=3074898 RepID=UPI00288A3852|nr:lysophospholipid acyltransferase family protein [Pontibacter sp. G13]WNJ19340.1 lysophospholipid acyltransferase family protein [Pontibacter sp. G13]
MRKSLQNLAYYLVLGLTLAISRLPFWVLYRISDVVFFLAYWVFKYRRKVVRDNIDRSFPNRSEAERTQIERKFYRHLADLMVEVVKGATLGDRALKRRVKVRNPEMFTEIMERGASSILLTSHLGNFEFLCQYMDIQFGSKVPSYAIYTKLSNPISERLVQYIRGRRGLQLIPMQHAMIKVMRALKEETCVVGFLADQSPHRGQRNYYTDFLHQLTAVHTSVAKFALKTKSPIYYADMRKVARGRYEVELIKMDTESFLPYSDTHIRDYTDFQVKTLEKAIEEQPEIWLWSHRRWKLKPKPGDYVAGSGVVAEPVPTEDKKPSL